MIKKYFLLLFSFFFVSLSFGQILSEDFSSVTPDENYSRIGWTNFAEEGTRVFQGKYYGTEDNYYVQMSAFGSGEVSNIAWLITPSVYITPGNVLNFRSKSGYTNVDVFSLWASFDYSGDVSTATWTELTFNEPTDDGSSYGDWQNSGAISLEAYAGSNVSFAFKYTGGDPSATTTWQVDDIKISQDAKVEVNPTTFDEEVESGSVVNTSFTISNIGGFNLDYTLAQAPWIITSVQSGTIASGESQVVNVTFDATNFFADVYHSEIQINTNDPENPIVIIPVTLTVTGEPNISIVETSIDYGDIFVNGSSTYELNIENTGTDVLNISSIVSDEAAFVTNLSTFTINAQSTQIVEVSFNPIDLVGYNGTLTITSDDADESVVTIALSGNGIAAPEASIDPAFFDVTVTGCDIIENQTLTISNLGLNNLAWSISDTLFFDNCEDNSQGWTTMTNGPDDLWHISSLDSYSENNSWWCGIEGEIDYATGNTIENGLVSPTIDLTGFTSAFLSFWEIYETEGFGYDFCNIDISINGGTDWIPVRNYEANGSSDGWINSFLDLTPFCGETVNIRFYFDTGDEIANNYSGWFIDDVLVAINPDNFLSFSKKSGLIGESGSEEIIVTADATGLDAGVYTNTFVVKTNDPLNASTAIVYDFTVNTIPIIELSKEAIDFQNIVVNEEGNKILKITNTGCDPLDVTSLIFSNVAYTSDAVLPIALQPNESIDVTITFSPTEELVYEGTITITNNDEEKVVTLTGEGSAGAPVISLSEDSFVVTSDICDEIQTYALTIFNTTGLSNLNYEIVQDQDGELVTLHAGTVAPSGSVIENIEIDATGLNSGDYDYTLSVNSNDPVNPTIVVPYTLTVNGLPEIVVSATALDFGEVLANYFAVDVFTITNNGCETLNVTDITSTLPEFTVDNSVFSLLPDQSIDIEVTFSPLSNISYNGTLTIVNDDSEKTVDVIGVGLSSPIAETNPASFDITLVGCDVIQNETLTINNKGTSDLDWELVAYKDYFWKDSNQPEGPVFEWFDISEIGTLTNLQGDDSSVAVDLPFEFNFYGQAKNSMLVSTNGYVTFGGGGTDFSNDDIPNTNDPDDYIAPLWDDLNGAGDGKNYYYYDSPNARFIVQYSDWPNLNSSGTYDFQIHLYANGEIYFYYQNLNGTLNESTIGIENSNGTEGLKIAYNQAYLENNLAIKISNIYPSDFNPNSGTIAAGGSQEVTAIFDASGLDDGTHLTNFYLISNDPANPLIEIPVSVTLVGEPEILLSDEAFDFGEVIVDQPSTQTLVVTNTGCKELNITDIVSSVVEFTVNNTVFTILPDETVEVEVTFTPVDVLAYNGTLTIVNDDVEQVITLTGLGIGAPEISATPASYSLTAVNCDEQVAETLTINNVGVSDLNWEVDPVAGVPTWLTMSSYAGTVNASGSIDIDLLFDAAGLTSGVYSSNIVIESNDPASPSTTIPVSLTVEGSPAIAVSPLALDFGQVNNGDSYQLDFAITNNGCADLEVTNIESDNAIFTISGTVFTVTPGNTEIVTATYSPVTEGEHTGTLTITSNDAEQMVALAGEALVAGTPIIQVLTTQLDFGDVYLGQISEVQQYTVSGTNLTEDIAINVPFGFQISTTSGSGFGNSITLAQAGGVVNTTTIYVRFAPTARKAYSELVSHVSTGAVQKDVALTGNGVVPANIYTSVQALTFNDVYANYQSAEQTYNISASGLSEDLIVTAPEGFVISNTSGGDFGSTLSYTPADGIVPTSTVFVKFAPSAVDTYVADIEHSSTGATTKFVEVNGRSLETYTVTFNVSDGAAPIIGAEVALTGYETQTTDATGVAIFTDVIPEAGIAYTVTAADYDDASGAVTVFDADVAEGVTMVLTTYGVTFTVTDGTDPISEAVVALTGYGTQTTDATGIAIFADVLPETGIAYTVTAADYDDASGAVTVVDADVAEGVTMVLTTYGVTFTVTDGTAPISGAEVALTGYGTQTTDATGIAIFTDVFPETAIAYTVTAADYDDASGAVTVVDADVAEGVTMVLTTYGVTFTVTDGTAPISGAEVALTGYGTQTTDATGIAIFADVLPEAAIAYTVTAADYDDASGAVTVVDADVAEGVTMVLTTYGVTFTVTDGTAPISGAEVALTGYGTQTTDATGIAIFADVLPETAIAYTVTAADYDDASGSVTVVDADVAEGVTMVLTTYTVTFTVTDQNEAPIEGAEIVIDETHNLTTDASGVATIELVDGTYAFTVAKDGYEGFSDNFTVTGEDLAISVAIHTTGVETGLLSTVKVYPNPFTTSITIGNASNVKHIVINNLIGQKVMEVELNGLDSETIVTDKLANGIYLITLINDRGEVVVKKMVKQ